MIPPIAKLSLTTSYLSPGQRRLISAPPVSTGTLWLKIEENPLHQHRLKNLHRHSNPPLLYLRNQLQHPLLERLLVLLNRPSLTPLLQGTVLLPSDAGRQLTFCANIAQRFSILDKLIGLRWFQLADSERDIAACHGPRYESDDQCVLFAIEDGLRDTGLKVVHIGNVRAREV